MSNHKKDIDRRQKGSDSSPSGPLDGKEIFLLVNGQKSGPFSAEQINEKITNKEILINISASIDGVKWYHLYEWSEFDRRLVHSSEELPGQPNEKVLSHVTKDSKNIHKNKERDFIAGLAYIGNLKCKNKNKYSHLLEDNPTKVNLALKYRGLWVSSLTVAIISICALNFIPQAKQRTIAEDTAPIKEKIKVPKATPIESVTITKEAKRAPIKKPAYKAASRKPKVKSFTQSKAFRNRAPRRAPAQEKKKVHKPVVQDPDDYYYDDGDDPVELDPVRSKVAKETLDPEDAPIDDYADDDYNKQRDPASEEIREEENPEKAFEALYE